MARVQRDSKSSASYPTTFLRWLQLKKYQYEVTFSLYMLTPIEKFVFNSILFILISLFVTAAFFYLPDHIYLIYSRISYYISGEFVSAHGNVSLPVKISQNLRGAKEVLVSQTIEAFASNSLQDAKTTVTNAVRDEI